MRARSVRSVSRARYPCTVAHGGGAAPYPLSGDGGLDPRDPLLRSERKQGLPADPYSRPWARALQGYLAHNKTPSHRTLQYALA